MIKKVFSVALIGLLFVSIVICNAIIGSVSANMVPPPSSSSPYVSFFSPSNQTYSTKNVQLAFMVAGAGAEDVTLYAVDGKTINQFYGSRSVSETLFGLSDGPHNVEVRITYFKDVWQSSAHVGLSTELISSISFTVASSIPSPSPSTEPSPSITPSPSPILTSSPLPTPTIEATLMPEPTSTPEQQTGFLGTNLPKEYGYAIITLAVIVAVAGLSLVYLKKLRK